MYIFCASPLSRTPLLRSACAVGVALAVFGCGEAAPTDVPSAAGAAGASFAQAGSGGRGPREPGAACRAPAGVSNAPRSIVETIALINALPKPLTLPCFLESLARPLSMHATFSVLSAQPALGARSPRVFLNIGPNTLSVVPEGVGAMLLEFGEERPEFRSLKGELTFPITGPVATTAPFEKLMFNQQYTTCALCHGAEQPDPTVSGVRAFVSQAFRPLPRDQVPLLALQHELEICDTAKEPQRCAMLDSLLGLGSLTDHQFPLGMATF